MRRIFYLSSLLTLLLLSGFTPANPPDCENDWKGFPLTHVPLIREQTCDCNGQISWSGGVESGTEFLACPVGFQPGDMWAKYWQGGTIPAPVQNQRLYIPLFIW